MPKNIYFQMSFEGGMVERPTQDYDYTDNQLKYKVPQSRTALYIENMDPTIVTRALTKRKGMALMREQPWNISAGLVEILGVPSGFTQATTLQVDLGRFTTLITLDPSGSQFQDKATMLGSIGVDYNRPNPQSIPLIFIRDVGVGPTYKQNTRIVGRYRNIVSEAIAWRNPHYSNNTSTTAGLGAPQAATYPGWEVVGTLSDIARHGGTLILTTNTAQELWPVNNNGVIGTFDWSQSWVNDMYPCYVWSYWDLRRIRTDNKFWNIISPNASPVTILVDLTANYSTDSKYSLFKVQTPTMYATRNTLVSFKYYGAEPLYDCNIADTGTLRTTFPTLVTDVPTTAIEIGILEVECRVFNSGRVLKTTPANGKMPESEDRLVMTTEWPYLNDDTAYLETIETLKTNALDPSDETGKYKKAEIVDIAVLSGIARIESVFDSNDYSWERSSGILTDNTNNNRKVDIIKAPEIIKETKNSGETYYTGIVGVALPDYLKNKNPRYWMTGERIPILVTLKVRGAEIIAGSYVHDIARWNTYPNFSLFSGYRYKTVETNDLFPKWSMMSPSLLPIQKEIRDDKMPMLDGSPVIQPTVSWWYYNDGNAQTAAAYKAALYTNHYPYYWEPFNPTAALPFVPDATTSYAQDYYYRPMGYNPTGPVEDGATAGYRRHHAEGPFVYFTVKVKKDKIGELLEMGLEAINIYVAESGDVSIMRSKGNRVVEDPDQGVYMYPATTDTDEIGKYRLVKTCLVNGEGNPFANATDYTQWSRDYYQQVIATNSWVEQANHIMATGQDKDGDATTYLTPDFCLWDYPAVTPKLSINSSGKYWQGRGASVVTNIKGRTFISGCIDQYGEEEQGTIRYSDVQNGVITMDLFSKENYIKLGGNPHVALAEFREQLWSFSRREVYRMQMPSITDTSTWEYLDKYPGQGTFSPKTVIATPLGVFWCNESGVWLSDGRQPENIAEPVQTVYQAMSSNQPQYYAQKITLPQFPYTEEGINPYLEISYDEEANEVIITSPTMTGSISGTNGNNLDDQDPNTEYRLIFDVETKTWRVETWDMPVFGSMLNEFDDRGEVTY